MKVILIFMKSYLLKVTVLDIGYFAKKLWNFFFLCEVAHSDSLGVIQFFKGFFLRAHHMPCRQY